MKRLIKILLLLFSFTLWEIGEAYSQDKTCRVSFETTIETIAGERFVVSNIYFTPLGNFDAMGVQTMLGAIELRADINPIYFSTLPTEVGNTDFSFIPDNPAWDDPTYFASRNATIVPINGESYMQIVRAAPEVSAFTNCLMGQMLMGQPCPLLMTKNVPYKFGTFRWKLLPTAPSGKLAIRIREYDIEEGALSCAAVASDNATVITLDFGDVERDASNAALITVNIPDDPLAGVDKPIIPDDGTDFAWQTYVCNPEQSIEYTVTRPTSVDSCVWLLTTDAEGKVAVAADVADIVVSAKGEKATVIYKKTEKRSSYYLQVYSVKGTNKSDYVYKSITVEGFPEFALKNETIACRSTELAWENGDGISTFLYKPDYQGGAQAAPSYTAAAAGTYHFVRYRTANLCQDTVDYTINFLDPKIVWLLPIPETVGRNEEIIARFDFEIGSVPDAYTPTSPATYIWTKPEGVKNTVMNYKVAAVAESYDFEVHANVDGCLSNTITGHTDVNGGGIQPNISSASGQAIACKDGGLLLESAPKGGIEPYSYKWYEAGKSDPIAEGSSSIWVTPNVETKYYVEVIDDKGAIGKDSLVVTYKDVATAIVEAGQDQGILKGSYTFITGTILSDAASTDYTWHWKPSDMLAGSASSSIVQTKALNATQGYNVYVVDGNGCMSKPDAMTVQVFPDLADGDGGGGSLVPENPDEPFEILLNPSNVTLCKNNSVQLTLQTSGINLEGATYAWTPAAGLDDANSASPILTAVDGVSSAEYLLTISKADFTIVRKVSVTVNEAEEAPLLQLAENRASCTGDVVEVLATGTAPDEYIWLVDGVQVANADSKYTLADAGEHHIKVYGKMTGATCASDTLSVDAVIGEGVTFASVSDDVKACGSEAKISFSSISPTDAAFAWVGPDDVVISETDHEITVNKTGVYRLIAGEGACSDTTKIGVQLNNVLAADGLKELYTGCKTSAELSFTATTATSFVWLDKEKKEIAGSKDQNPYTVSEEGFYFLAMDGGDCKDTVRVGVQLNTTPLVDVKIEQTTCGTELAINGTTSAGTLFWAEDNTGKNAISEGSVNGSNETKTYYVYADAGDCVSDMIEVKVGFGQKPTVIADAFQTSCELNYTLQATSTGTGEVKWYASETSTNAISASVSGAMNTSVDYWACAEDSEGCVSDRQKVTVQYGVIPTLTVKNLQTTCAKELQLEASTTGGSIVWRNEAGELLTTKVAGESGEVQNYEVYAEDGKCVTATEKVEVRFGTKPEVLAQTLQTTCGDVYTLQGNASDGNLTWYSDKGITKLPSLEVAKSGSTVATYYAQAGEDGCKSELLEVRVAFGTAPVVEVITPRTSCMPGSVVKLEATTTGGSLVWENKDGDKIGTSVTTAGTYYAYAVDVVGANTCTSSKEAVEVKFGENPIVLAEALQTTCGTEYTLKGEASGGELRWLNVRREPISAFVTGSMLADSTYYVYAKDGDCQSDEKEIHVGFGKVPTVTVDPVQTTCETVYKLQASTSGGDLIWTQGGNVLPTSQVSGDAGQTVTYKVYAQGVGGCKSNPKEVKVTFGSKPEVTVEPLQTSCGEDYTLIASASEGATINWLAADKVNPVTEQVTGALGTSATYWVYAEKDGCKSDYHEVTVAFGEMPKVEAHDLTTCGTSIELTVTSISGGNAVWKDAGGTIKTNTIVSGVTGMTDTYYVYAEDGKCLSEEQEVKVSFGSKPKVVVDKDITTCGQEYVLAGTSTDNSASIYWLADDKKTPVTIATGSTNSSKTYYVYAKKDEYCVGDTTDIKIHFGKSPVLNVPSLQTTCDTILVLKAESSVKDLVWEDKDGKVLASSQIRGDRGTNAIYYVTAVDGKCTSSKESVKVEFGKAPELIVEPIQTVCTGNTYELQGDVTGGKLVWYQSNGTTILTNTTVGKVGDGIPSYYYAQAVDGECASDLEKVTVYFDRMPEIEVNDLQTTCGEVINLSATATAGDVVWTTLAGDELSLPQATGTTGETQKYYVFARDESCESAKELVTVKFGTKPEIEVEEVQTACGEEHVLKATASNGILHWETEDGTELTDYTVTGKNETKKYFVYAENGKDCQSNKVSVTVIFGSEPLITAITPQTTCGTTIHLKATASAGDVVWTTSTGTVLETTQITETNPGAYTYYVKAQDGDCVSATKEITVKFGSMPEIVAELKQTTCETEHEIIAVATQGDIHYLDTDGKTELIDAIAKGNKGETKTYFVYAQGDDAACKSDLTEIEVAFGAKPTVTVETNQSTCEDVLHLEATATGGELVWKNQGGEVLLIPQVKEEDGTTYYVYATAGSGCSCAPQMVNVEFGAKPVVTVEELQTSCSLEYALQATASMGAVLHWLDEAQVTDLGANPTVTGNSNESKIYWVYATKGECRSEYKKVTVAFGVAPMLTVADTLTSCGTELTLTASKTAGELKWMKPDNSGGMVEVTNLTVKGMIGKSQEFYVSAVDGDCQSETYKVIAKFGSKPSVLVDELQTACEGTYQLQAIATDGELHWLKSDMTTEISATVTGAPNESVDYYVYAQHGDDATCKMDQPKKVTVVFGAAPEVKVMTPQSACGEDGATEATINLKATTTGGDLIWENNANEKLASLQLTKPKGTIEYYYVHAEDGKCKSVREKVEVRFGARPVVLAEAIQTSCGEELTLKAETSAGKLVWLKGTSVLTSTTVKPEGGNAYIVYAKDGNCESEQMQVEVAFNTKPLLTVTSPQTACEGLLKLQATASEGKVVWEDVNGKELPLAQVTGTVGETDVYYAYAQGNGCASAKELVEVRFGVDPEVIVEEEQTACGKQHVLAAKATAGDLIWLQENKTTVLSSTTVTGELGTTNTYYVYAKADGCESAKQKVTVHFGQSPMLTALPLQTTCEEVIALKASTTSGSLVWKNEMGGVLETPQVSGAKGTNAYYYVTAVDGECQSSTERVEVRFGAQPEVLADAVQTTCGNEYILQGVPTSGKINWYASNGVTLLKSTLVKKPEGGNRAEYYAEAQNGSCVGEKQKVTVAFGTNPLVTVVTPQTTCDSIIALKATTTGGNLVWTNAMDEKLIHPIVKGKLGTDAVYFVHAENEDGSCQSPVEEVNVYFGQAPRIIAEQVQSSCGTTLELEATATGGAPYWLKSDKVSVLEDTRVDVSDPTTYYVYAKDGSCTSDTIQIEAQFGTTPVLTVVSPQTSCNNMITLEGTTTGGSIEWTRVSNGEKVILPVITQSGSGDETFTARAVDGSCASAPKTVIVKFNTQPEVLVETLQTTCDTVHTLVGAVSAGEIVWEDESHQVLKDIKVHGRGSKTYYAYAHVSEDCESEPVKVTVVFETAPVMDVLAKQTACGTKLELKGSVSGGELVWKAPDGTILTQNQITMDKEKTEIYTVYAQDGACVSAEQEVTVAFKETPEVIVVTPQTTCGTEYKLQAQTTGGILHWVDEGYVPVGPIVNKSGIVYVYAEDGECTTEATPIEVTVLLGTKPTLTVEYDQYTCSSPYKLQASTTGGKIVWENAAHEKLLTDVATLEEGENIFFVHVEDETCTPVSTVTEKVTVHLSGKPELSLSDVRCMGDTLHAIVNTGTIGEVTFRWFVDGTLQAGYASNYYVFAAAGKYNVKVVGEVAGGCVSDTATGEFSIAAPMKLAWDPKPAENADFGKNVNGCATVSVGDIAKVKTWNWLAPSADHSGQCINISVAKEEYDFKVYAVDINGCLSDTLEAHTDVTGFNALDLTLESASGTEICEGGSGLLTAMISGGQSPYTYEWYVKNSDTPIRKITTSSVADVFAVNPTEGVTYEVKVKDSQDIPGIAKAEITLTVKSGASLPVADAGPDMTIQKGLQTVLKGGSADSWNWVPVDKLNASDESGKQYPLTAKLSTSQIYQLYVKDASGCISLPDEMVVYVLPLDGTEEGIPTPPVSEGLDLVVKADRDTLCLGNETWISVKDRIGNLSGTQSYTWLPATGLTFNAKRDSALFRPTTAGDYSFVIMVEDGGKKMALRSDIVVKDAYAPQFALESTGSCQGDTVRIVYADGSVKATDVTWKVKNTAIEWNNDYYVLTNTGTYKVDVVAENNNCMSAQASTEVTVNTAPVITDFVLADSCGQAVVEVTATGATAGYSWSATPTGVVDPLETTRYVVSGTGNFKVTVTAANDVCSVSRTLEGEIFGRPELGEWVTEPVDVSKNASISAAVNVKTGTGTPDYTYHWMQPDEAKTTTNGSYTLTPATLANYTFQVYASDAKGCVSDTLLKTVDVSGGDIKVNITSVYGDQVCQGGAAMLVAQAQGMTTPCVFEWKRGGVTVRTINVTTVYDTLWIKASQVDEYQVNVKKSAATATVAMGKLTTLAVATSKEAPEVTTEAKLTIQAGGQTILPSTVKKGTPDYQWHWSPAGQLANLSDTAAQYAQTAKLTANQTYQVYVTDANSCVSVPATTEVYVDNTNGLCVAIDPQTKTICRGNTVQMIADVTCGKPTEWLLDYTWLPAENSSLLSSTNKDTVVFTPTAEGEYPWFVKVTNGGFVAIARAVVTVQDADAPQLSFEGRWDCVNDTLKLNNIGEVAESYVWTIDDVIAGETSERFVLADKDIKHVEVYAKAANGCQSDVLTRDLNLGVIPEVEIAGGSFVNYPDSINVIKVKQGEDLSGENYTFAWLCNPTDKFNGSTDELSVTTMPMTEDVKYTFVATSKTNTVCAAADSVWGYMIPKKVNVNIDKDESGSLYISWNKDELGLADSVRVMHNRWDGYGIISAYSNKAMLKGDLEKYLINTSKDTLEFFYINASRYIEELDRSYYALASDTVGYMNQWLYADSKGTTQQNFLAYPFDMLAIKTTGDIIKYAGFNSTGKYAISTVGYWDGDAWRSVSATSANIIGNANNVEVETGNVYRIILRNKENVGLQFYGKLPQKFTYNLSVGKQNFILTPLSIGNSFTRFQLGDLIPGIKNVGSFTFSDQGWKNSAKSGAGIWGGTTGDFNVKVWRALRVILNDSATSVIWSY